METVFSKDRSSPKKGWVVAVMAHALSRSALRARSFGRPFVR